METSVKACYIHIPFCSHICSYCDFCKLFYEEKIVDNYLLALEKEIEKKYRGEELETIYIGGGTPSSLNLKQLAFLFSIIEKLNMSPTCEFTIECNVENVDLDKLNLFRQHGVNRISLGVESFQDNLLKKLSRPYTKQDIFEAVSLIRSVGFSNLNVDLMYALPGESLEDLRMDIDGVLQLNVDHISTYSLMIEEHTSLYLQGVEPIDEELDEAMYHLICQVFAEHGFTHYEISNFAKEGKESRHNLTYWKNERYYGFGLGASGFVDDIRYTNTRSIGKYCEGEFLGFSEKLSDKTMRENELILGLRTSLGIDKQKFIRRYGKDLKEFFSLDQLLEKKWIVEEVDKYYIPEDKWYVSNEILLYFIGEK